LACLIAEVLFPYRPAASRNQLPVSETIKFHRYPQKDPDITRINHRYYGIVLCKTCDELWDAYVSARTAHRQAVVVSLQTKDPRAADLLQVSADDARLELLSHKASHGKADSRWFSGPLS